uniref:Aminopeptidase n=1 Tax=Callorhinchus milii TaxID=7868 RepID=A0A4W3HH61_CALMI
FLELGKQDASLQEESVHIIPTIYLWNSHVYVVCMEFSVWFSLVVFHFSHYCEIPILIFSFPNRFIAATDHEPTDARKSFPCFDEPNKKATYTISLIYSELYNVLSNMPPEHTEDLGNGQKKTIFQKSVPMSTYLVCFAVHQFDFIESNSKRGIPLRIYVQPQQKHTAVYAANVTKIIFDFFEEYFAINYSLPKLDMIAIPDFGTGAMENWGLITYRETNLLYDPAESSSTNKQRVASVVAHELVHQWFGNIVTMNWWDDLWLNEGFASFFEYIGVNAAESEWEMLDQILIDDVLSVMVDDALLSSHPIIVNVSTPAEITSVFDGISYSKGASILRMLRDWMTPELFQRGCQKYLKDNQFKNAKTDDFWKAQAEVSGKQVKEVMDTWTNQMGYPVLQVQKESTIIQSRFILDPSIDLPYNSTTDGLLKINTNHVGFYRANYEEPTWDKIIEQIIKKHEVRSQTQACHLHYQNGTSVNFYCRYRASLLNYFVPLNLTKYLKNETEYLPWVTAVKSSLYIENMLKDDNTLYPMFQEYWKNQVKPIVHSLGWKDEGEHLERLLRTDVLGLACQMGDEEALSNASQLFNRWLTGARVEPNLRLLVYRYGMQTSGNVSSWEYMFKRYQETPLAQEKDKLMYGLASVENIQLLGRYLNYIKNESLIKSQDVFTVLRYISLNKYGKTMAFDWARMNWEYLVERFTINDRNLGRLIPRITTSYNTELQLWQMNELFYKYPDAGAGKVPRKQALETVETNINWLKNNKATIAQWLQDNVNA